MTLPGLSFVVLVAPLTAAVLSSVSSTDESLASGINNAASRIAQLAGIALAAGVSSFAYRFQFGMISAAVASIIGVVTIRVAVR